ncbi:hypothetical protein PGTUg99_020614 [Puccinia graminis f. sp. tritici]|uniref:Uncharacterized protein n=1 Tax=Puccinia graminis f. sp. tritici TaxID=56615 RepID=A0A5B0RTI1_PUCGR|nr:hypothetical protein PGTUg99_020614 [Puccinia graminis f. sp. tritici]
MACVTISPSLAGSVTSPTYRQAVNPVPRGLLPRPSARMIRRAMQGWPSPPAVPAGLHPAFPPTNYFTSPICRKHPIGSDLHQLMRPETESSGY